MHACKMDFENESPNYYSSSPSSISQNSPSDSSHEKAIVSKTDHKKFKETRHPVYKGIRQRNDKKWVCEVGEPNKNTRILLGTYPTPQMAAIAHDVAILALKGISAILNFPESASFLLPFLPSTNSAENIREAASKAAKAFPSTLSSSSSSINNLSVEITNSCDDVNVNRSEFAQQEIMNNDEYNKSMFFDEEVLYNMPGFLDSMAEGLLITPPSMKRALDWDEVECEMDLTLWTD